MPFTGFTAAAEVPLRSDPPDDFAGTAEDFLIWMVLLRNELVTFLTELETAAALINAAPAYADAGLVSIANLDIGADEMLYGSAANTFSKASLTAAARTLLAQTSQANMRTAGLGMSANGSSLVSAANYAAMRALLDLEAGTDFLSPAAIAAGYQPLDSDLTAIAALATTSFGRSLLTQADAAAARTILGVTGSASSSGSATSGYMDIPSSGLGTIRLNWGRTTVGANDNSSPSLAASYSTALNGFGQAMSSSTSDSDSSYCYLSSTTQMSIANGTDGSLTFQWAAIGVV